MIRWSTVLFPFALLGCGSSGGAPSPTPDAGAVTPDAGASADTDAGTMDPTVRDFALEVRGLTADQNRPVDAWLVETTGNHVVGHVINHALSSLDSYLRLPGAVQGAGYRVDFWADTNGNGHYDPPPVDHAWSLAVPDTGDATVIFDYHPTFMDIGALPRIVRKDVTVTLHGMAAEMGAPLELRVTDTSSQATVGAWSQPSTADTVSVAIPGCVDEGAVYAVDFYTDLDHSGGYSAPPADHAWRVMATATASGVTLDWTHTDGYTDIAWR